MSENIVSNLSKAITWWEMEHRRQAPKIYVSSLYPKDFANIDDFGPNAKEKLRGMWDKRQNAITLLANIQTLHPNILVSLLFHELGHCLRGHATNDNPPNLKEEREAEKVAVQDYIAYFGKDAIVPQDPRLGDAFYQSLGLRKVSGKPPTP